MAVLSALVYQPGHYHKLILILLISPHLSQQVAAETAETADGEAAETCREVGGSGSKVRELEPDRKDLVQCCLILVHRMTILSALVYQLRHYHKRSLLLPVSPHLSQQVAAAGDNNDCDACMTAVSDFKVREINLWSSIERIVTVGGSTTF